MNYKMKHREVLQMEYIKEIWRGFEMLKFELDGRKAILVKPECPCEGNKWLLKTEYFDAFPDFEIEMIKRGYYLAYISNKTRWHDVSDDVAKERLCRFLSEEFGLCDRCMPVGMSCGGMHAIYFATAYSERVAAMYLDAPVINLLSCPAGIGKGTTSMYDEFRAATGMTVIDLINYRNHPIDNIKSIIENNIPVFLVGGDSDDIVPFDENGEVLYNLLKANNADITKIVKKGCNHHPHGLKDNTPLIEFTLKNY